MVFKNLNWRGKSVRRRNKIIDRLQNKTSLVVPRFEGNEFSRHILELTFCDYMRSARKANGDLL